MKNARPKSKLRKPRFYTTFETSLIVACPEWRVKNFGQPAYGLPPSQILGGGGRGSRRLYSYLDVERVAIADELVRCGFSPEAVGAGVKEIPESVFNKWTDYDVNEARRGQKPMLVAHRGEWQVMKAQELSSIFEDVAGDTVHRRDVFVLNIVRVLEDTLSSVTDLEVEGKIKP